MKLRRAFMDEAGDGSLLGAEVSTSSEPQTETPSWFYQAPGEDGQGGIGGNGEVPEWFKVDKYKSVDEQARAYADLEKRFGGFTGAPETYELPEGYDSEDPLLSKVMEFGKAKQMGNESFNELLGLYSEVMQEQSDKATAQAMEALGEKAQERISNVQNWLNTNAPKEMVDIIAPMATSAESIQALEWFIEKSKSSSVAPNDVAPQVKMTQSEYAEKLMAKDNHGNLRINSDLDYKKQMDELAKQFIS